MYYFNRLAPVCYLLLILFLFPYTVRANPVSFKDGWGIMPTYSTDWSDLEVNYSLTNQYSVGVSSFYRNGSDNKATFDVAQFNYLIERWNELDSQASIYASLGLGGRHDSNEGNAIASYSRLEGDYETRRIYTFLGFESLQSPESVEFNRLRYRIGVAPYLAPFTGLQTWMILQVDDMPQMKDEVVVTPLLRFFYDSYALELGVSLDGKPYVGGMAHF